MEIGGWSQGGKRNHSEYMLVSKTFLASFSNFTKEQIGKQKWSDLCRIIHNILNESPITL